MEQPKLIKAAFFGKNMVGKTQLMKSLIFSKFSEQYIPTIGVEFDTKEISYNSKKYKIQLWDSQTIKESYYKGSHFHFVVFDITNQESFDEVSIYLSGINENNAENKKLIYLIGNKSDLDSERVVTKKDAEKFAGKNGIKYFEVSAKSPNTFKKVILNALDDFIGEENIKIRNNEINFLF